MRIAISVPFYKFMEAKAVESLISMMAHIHSKGDVYYPVFSHAIGIDQARNIATKVIIEHIPEAEYVLFLDTDQVYSGEALYKLRDRMEKDGLVQLSAAYSARNMPGIYAHLKSNPETGKAWKITIEDTKDMNGELFSAYSVGFGFNLFKRDFLVEMSKKYKPLFKNNPEEQIGEDVYFCELQKKEGVKVLFDPKVRVGHISSVVL
jgi:hypothetical protein